MNKNQNQIIAQRYAKSLLELEESNKLDTAAILQNLNNINTILKSSQELFSILINPVVSLSDKQEVIEEVFKNDTDALIRNFLKLLVEKNRFDLIFEIIKAFNVITDKINKVAKVEVISAIELDEDFKNKIQNKLSEILKKQTIVSYETNDDIIAGLVYKIGDDVFDTSIAYKLNKFKHAITK